MYEYACIYMYYRYCIFDQNKLSRVPIPAPLKPPCMQAFSIAWGSSSVLAIAVRSGDLAVR